MTTLITILTRLASPPPQTLHTHQPTSSTVTYTVTTRPALTGLCAKLGFYVGISARVVLGMVAVLVVCLKWCVSLGIGISVLGAFWGEGGERGMRRIMKLIEITDGTYIIPLAILVLFLACKRNYKEESLTIISGLGLQTSTTSSFYLRSPSTRFISTTAIQDIFIHEAFKGFEVRFYLAVVVEGEREVVVVFPSMLPRRGILEEVWREGRKCLWEMGEKG
ncbi:hypothetical protein P280DRAFT_474600 [Massarina eburnea CBS 473.64]|uniref:Phosphatidylinositol N-acetylglucosaminyltransferase subunit H conserved domain-containing protein n=1 Tax=Massarina eburnea CBS 473.64 TaxID=1395130 RepID=A0A6A6RGY6_9PLEO|nr:hypothetical protein P280DRAFT_474600 [Massarina eburnea CBS 473.64]